MGAAEDTQELTPEEVAEYRRELRPALRALSKLVSGVSGTAPRKSPREAHPDAEDYAIARKRLRGKMRSGNLFWAIRAPSSAGVYAVQGSGSYVKIGRASNIAERIKALQTGHPVPLRLIAVLSSNPDDERGFHERWSYARREGEWFAVTADMIAFITEARGKQ